MRYRVDRAKDLSGVDVNAAAQRSIVPDLYHTHAPCQMVQDAAARGDLGVKTGKGFYDWNDRDVTPIAPRIRQTRPVMVCAF